MFASDNSHLCRNVDVVNINTVNGATNCLVRLRVRDVVLGEVLRLLSTLGAINVTVMDPNYETEYKKVSCNVDNHVIARTLKHVFHHNYDPVSNDRM